MSFSRRAVSTPGGIRPDAGLLISLTQGPDRNAIVRGNTRVDVKHRADAQKFSLLFREKLQNPNNFLLLGDVARPTG
jgi:hypothetical protein